MLREGSRVNYLPGGNFAAGHVTSGLREMERGR